MNTSKWINRAFFCLFTLLFFGEIVWLSAHINVWLAAPLPLWVLAGLAAMRLGKTVSYNGVAEWFRWPFVHEVEDTSGAGFNNEAKPGFFNVIGQLITCPICSGTWAASFLITVYCISPTAGAAFIVILGVAGISEFFVWSTEAIEWTGRAQREAAGTAWLIKNRGTQINAYSETKQVNHTTPRAGERIIWQDDHNGISMREAAERG